MTIYRFAGHAPRLHGTSYVADSATVIGRVVLERDSSVWSQAVLRADNETIVIGPGSNVREGALLQIEPGFPLRIGASVTVGHQAMLQGCTVGDGSLIGIQAVVLHGAVIGRHCLVAAGAVVSAGKVFPDRCLILGAPAKAVRRLADGAIAELLDGARDCVERARRYRALLERTG